MPEAKRTLVKSAPELWAEVSDPAALARHLAPFGSVRITATRPETEVEWAGEKAAGTVTLESSGFGTRVTLRATVATAEPEPQAEPAPAAMAEPEPEPDPAPGPAAAPEAPRRGLWSRLLRRRAPEPPAPADPVEPVAAPVPEPAPEPAPAPPASQPVMSDEAALLVLTDTLEALGKAHHRPFSRA